MTLTEPAIHVLLHATGWSTAVHAAEGGYRSHYCAGPDAVPACEELVAAGLAVRRDVSWVPDATYLVNETGQAIARGIAEKRRPRLTRSQERYRRFLRLDSGLTFREFLTMLPGPDHE